MKYISNRFLRKPTSLWVLKKELEYFLKEKKSKLIVVTNDTIGRDSY